MNPLTPENVARAVLEDFVLTAELEKLARYGDSDEYRLRLLFADLDDPKAKPEIRRRLALALERAQKPKPPEPEPFDALGDHQIRRASEFDPWARHEEINDPAHVARVGDGVTGVRITKDTRRPEELI